VGGYDKKIALTAMFGPLVERAKAVLCIGATGEAIAKALSEASRIGAAQVFACHDLATAIKIAKQNAASGDVVLLSTGCASYDQFENFEKRGEAFAELARGGTLRAQKQEALADESKGLF
jgi:UDP-N-acetylmuramoylalanine--D-glutamate ligase